MRKLYLISALVFFLLSCASEPKVLDTFQYISDGNSTAFEQLRMNHAVDYDSSAMGIFVKAIDGVEQSRTAFWLYFINGESKPEAAGTYIPAEGDTVEWRLISGY